MADKPEALGKCEWCGGVVAEDHDRSFSEPVDMWWHQGCAERLQNLLSEAVHYDAEPEDSGASP